MEEPSYFSQSIFSRSWEFVVNDTQLRVCFFYDEKRPIEFDPYPGENNTTKFAACNQSQTHHGNHADVMEFDPNMEKKLVKKKNPTP